MCPSYSFLDTDLAITGPGGAVNLGAGSAAAEEGVTIEPVEDKNVMTIGADGAGMHSLVASEAATMTVRLLKTSPQNALLQVMYNLQTTSSRLWGSNTVALRNNGLGDYMAGQQVAFKRNAPVTYAKEGGIVEWQFDIVKWTKVLGTGITT